MDTTAPGVQRGRIARGRGAMALGTAMRMRCARASRAAGRVTRRGGALAAVEGPGASEPHAAAEPVAEAPAAPSPSSTPYAEYGNSGLLWLRREAPGMCAPLSEDGTPWDPWGFLTLASVDDAKRFAEAEVTHARLAMLAAVGWLVGEETVVENNPLFNGAVSGPALHQFDSVEAQGGYFWEVLLLFIAACETARLVTVFRPLSDTGRPSLLEISDSEQGRIRVEFTPGDLGFDPLGLLPSDPAEAKLMRTKELQNGRLAMLAVVGFCLQEEVNGLKVFENLGDKWLDDIGLPN